MRLFIFEQKNLASGVETTVRTVEGGKNIFDINICATAEDATVKLSVTVGGTTTHLEHSVVVPVGTPLVRTKEMFPPGAVIKCESNIAGVDVTLAGIEEDV